MQKDYKNDFLDEEETDIAENEKNGRFKFREKIAIKRFYFIYAFILFSCALGLILLAGALQTQTLKELQSSLQTNTENFKNTWSMLNSVQEMNDILTKENSDLKISYNAINILMEKNKNKIDKIDKWLTYSEYLAEAQTLYIKGKKDKAIEAMNKIEDPEMLTDKLKADYDYMFELLEMVEETEKDSSESIDVINTD